MGRWSRGSAAVVVGLADRNMVASTSLAGASRVSIESWRERLCPRGRGLGPPQPRRPAAADPHNVPSTVIMLGTGGAPFETVLWWLARSIPADSVHRSGGSAYSGLSSRSPTRSTTWRRCSWAIDATVTLTTEK